MINGDDGIRSTRSTDDASDGPRERTRLERRSFLAVASGATVLPAISSIVAGTESSDIDGYGESEYGVGGYGGVDGSESDDEKDGNGASTNPNIDRLELRDRSNPQWARVEVDWSVSHSDGSLQKVESVLTGDGWGSASESTSVSGSDADSEHDHRIRHGHDETYEVEFTVTDAAGNTATETATIDL